MLAHSMSAATDHSKRVSMAVVAPLQVRFGRRPELGRFGRENAQASRHDN